MSGKGLTTWLFLSALLSTLAGAAPNGAPEADRKRILAALADQIPPARLDLATVFLGGDLAALRLPTRGGESVVYVFERSADDNASWSAVARITAPEEKHFGDAVLLSPNAILVAAPDVADAGLGPGATYVFQRHVGGPDQWGLVAKLAPGDYPPPGAIRVQPLVEPAIEPAPATPPPAALATPPPPVETTAPLATGSAPSPTRVVEPLPPAAMPPPAVVAPSPASTPPPVAAAEENPPVAEIDPPPAAAEEGQATTEAAVMEAKVMESKAPADPVAPTATEAARPVVPPATPIEAPPTAPSTAAEVADARPSPTTLEDKPPTGDDGSSAPAGELRYIAVANMKERPRALALAASLRDKGYPSEVHRNERGFFVVTLARLPRAEARTQRNQAVAAGDVSREAYLIVGTSFREKISP